MTDQNTAPSAAPAEPVATPSPSPDDALRSIASELNVEEQAKTFTATPQTTQPLQVPQYPFQQSYTPDPVTDQDGYKAWVTAQNQTAQHVLSTLQNVQTEVNSFRQIQQQQRVNADVDRAVEFVNSTVKVNPKLLEARLNLEYSENPSFRKIFDNRDKNQAAYQKALGVVRDKIASEFQVRTDPQLVENVRAARSSQQTMATTKQMSQNEEVGNMNDLEFQKWWQSQRQG